MHIEDLTQAKASLAAADRAIEAASRRLAKGQTWLAQELTERAEDYVLEAAAQLAAITDEWQIPDPETPGPVDNSAPSGG